MIQTQIDLNDRLIRSILFPPNNTMARPTLPTPSTVSAQVFEDLVLELIGKQKQQHGPNKRISSRKVIKRKFRAFVGCDPKHCAIVWKLLFRAGYFKRAPAASVKPIHLLMGFHFIKKYNPEEDNARAFDCDEKTFRQWSWFMMKGIARLDKKIVSAVCVGDCYNC